MQMWGGSGVGTAMEMTAPAGETQPANQSEDTESAIDEKMNNNIPEGKAALLQNEKLKQRRQRRLAENSELFLGNSTCHGMHYCFDAKFRVQRFVWTILVLASLIFLASQVYEGALKYMAYPFTTTTTLVYASQVENRPLPAIAICNRNDFRRSVMGKTKLGKMFARGASAEEIMNNVTAEEYSNTTLSSYHLIDDMLVSCEETMLSMQAPGNCSKEEFTPFFKTQGEKCFTYTPTNGANRVTMTIDIEFDEYDPKNRDAGIIMILHSPDAKPVKAKGVQISPGFKTHVLVSETKIENLPSPYKANCGSRPFKYFKGAYSKDMCELEKLTDHVVKECNCKDSFMPGSADVCSFRQLLLCGWSAWEAFKKIPSVCPLACQQTMYETFLSQSLYPSQAVFEGYKAEQLAKGNNISDEAMWRKVGQNRLEFEVYYQHDYHEHMIQEPTYDVPIMLGDLGGKLGLFLGTSILTYIEFFDYFVVAVYSRFIQK